jgi:hypothetical protein
MYFIVENRLRVFETEEKRKLFAPKRENVIGGWRKLKAH